MIPFDKSLVVCGVFNYILLSQISKIDHEFAFFARHALDLIVIPAQTGIRHGILVGVPQYSPDKRLSRRKGVRRSWQECDHKRILQTLSLYLYGSDILIKVIIRSGLQVIVAGQEVKKQVV